MNKESVQNIPDFYKKYVELVENEEIVLALEKNMQAMMSFWGNLPSEKEDHRYAPEKWTPKEILGHLIDAERIMSTRALRFARNDQTELPGFDENAYVPASSASERSMANLITEFMFVRQATIALFKTFDEETFAKSGLASNAKVSVGAWGYIMVGHGIHHRQVIEERYL